jgi:exosortase A-associated hydrolase 2
MIFQPSYLSATNGKLFSLLRLPETGSVKAIVVLVPPFAEEMNKSRHMFAQLSACFAESNMGTLLFDYYGTGESEGHFEDASLKTYAQDLKDVIAHVSASCCSPQTPIYLVCLRMGALVALHAWQDMQGVSRVALWNPVVSGKILVNQFFRLRLASNLTSSSGKKDSAQTIKDELKSVGSTEVAGYTLGQSLVEELEASSIDQYITEPGFQFPPVVWFEASSPVRESMLPVSTTAIEKFTRAGVLVEGYCVEGSQFWTTQEITVAPYLIAKTVAWFVDETGSCGGAKKPLNSAGGNP